VVTHPLPRARAPAPAQLNIANPNNGAMKIVEVDDEKRLVQFYDKRMSQEIEGDFLGDEYKGYVFRCVLAPRGCTRAWCARTPRRGQRAHARRRRPSPIPRPLRSITGGNDKQGFPMAQGIMSNGRVRLLMAKGATYYRERRDGERKRKTVRGCIVGSDLSTLNLIIVKKGEGELPGLTNAEAERPNRLGLKRASKIRKYFGLAAGANPSKYVVTRKYTAKKSGKEHEKRPRIQRLVTPLTLQHARQRLAEARKSQDRHREEKSAYEQLLKKRNSEAKAKRASAKLSRRSSKKEVAA
jgi:small subunit ribosomal protein S6e